MSEQAGTTAESSASKARGSSSGTSVARREDPGTSALQSDRGTTTIADVVVTKIAGIAAREVSGVHDLGGGAARAIGSVTQRVGLGDERTQGVSVEAGEREAAVDLTLVVEYGESIPRVTEAVRDNVVRRIEGITGLKVTEVNVAVNDLYFPDQDAPEEPARVQ